MISGYLCLPGVRLLMKKEGQVFFYETRVVHAGLQLIFFLGFYRGISQVINNSFSVALLVL